MRFSNKSIIPILKIGYVVFILFLIGFVYSLQSKKIVYSKLELLVIVMSFLFGFMYWYARAKFFEYDGSGSAVVFLNKGILISELTDYRENRVEFPKSKLKSYKVKGSLFSRQLSLYLKSSNKLVKRVDIDITFVKPNQIQALRASLNKIIKDNNGPLI